MHYVGWPDHGIPTGESMEDFKKTLHEFIHYILNYDARAIVHCSAGIGRTGTIISLLHIIVNLHA